MILYTIVIAILSIIFFIGFSMWIIYIFSEPPKRPIVSLFLFLLWPITLFGLLIYLGIINTFEKEDRYIENK